jgi:Ca2+-binding EF-hand superfamily protein
LISQQTTIIFQCIAATSLVVAGNFLIAKEEEEEKEREEKEAKEEAERAKKREEMMASGNMTKEECDVALGGAKKAVEEEEYDIWRDSLLRYLGYSNELGEALRPVLPAAYLASYCLAFAYVFADSIDKGGRADKKKRLRDAKNTFLTMDTGCEGYLTKEEVQAAFKKLKTPLSEKDIDSYFAKIDTSGNQKIELEEFMAAFEKKDDELVSLIEALEKPKEDGGPLGNPSLIAGADALIWQVIASVALPGFTINRFVTLTEIGCEAQAESSIVAEYLPTVFGLSLIPIVCKPLDELADFGLDATLRPLLFSTLNADTTGTVEFSELSKKLKERDGSTDEKALRQLFDEMDTDNNGCITAEDWSNGGFERYRAFVERK